MQKEHIQSLFNICLWLKGMMWQEQARWIKFEENLLEGAERWGKPHIASLSFHSVINLRQVIEDQSKWNKSNHGHSEDRGQKGGVVCTKRRKNAKVFFFFFFVSPLLRDCSLCWDRWRGTWLLHLTRPCQCVAHQNGVEPQALGRVLLSLWSMQPFSLHTHITHVCGHK